MDKRQLLKALSFLPFVGVAATKSLASERYIEPPFRGNINSPAMLEATPWLKLKEGGGHYRWEKYKTADKLVISKCEIVDYGHTTLRETHYYSRETVSGVDENGNLIWKWGHPLPVDKYPFPWAAS